MSGHEHTTSTAWMMFSQDGKQHKGQMRRCCSVLSIRLEMYKRRSAASNRLGHAPAYVRYLSEHDLTFVNA